MLALVWSTASSTLKTVSVMEEEGYKHLFKIVMVGTEKVGKTCLVRQFTEGVFPTDVMATIGVDFMVKTVNVDGDTVKLQIWDTAGQERFRSITQSYYRSAHAIVLVFDVACQPSFDCLPEWLAEIEQYANRKVFKILVGNKIDKDDDREVPTRIGEAFAKANGFEYFLETSALNATNVDTLFTEVGTKLVRDLKSNESRRGSDTRSSIQNPPQKLSLWNRASKNASSCCSGMQKLQ